MPVYKLRMQRLQTHMYTHTHSSSPPIEGGCTWTCVPQSFVLVLQDKKIYNVLVFQDKYKYIYTFTFSVNDIVYIFLSCSKTGHCILTSN